MVDLQDHLNQIRQLQAEVIGVSSAPTVRDMAVRLQLEFPMLHDEDGTVCQIYEAYDRIEQRVKPTTYVISKQGLIYSKYREQLLDCAPVLEDLRALKQ